MLANLLHGALLAYVPPGNSIAIPVSASICPCASVVNSFIASTSYLAAGLDSFVARVAFTDSPSFWLPVVELVLSLFHILYLHLPPE